MDFILLSSPYHYSIYETALLVCLIFITEGTRTQCATTSEDEMGDFLVDLLDVLQVLQVEALIGQTPPWSLS